MSMQTGECSFPRPQNFPPPMGFVLIVKACQSMSMRGKKGLQTGSMFQPHKTCQLLTWRAWEVGPWFHGSFAWENWFCCHLWCHLAEETVGCMRCGLCCDGTFLVVQGSRHYPNIMIAIGIALILLSASNSMEGMSLSSPSSLGILSYCIPGWGF